MDVKAAGGWKDTQTLITSYQRADEAGMIEVMSSPVKLRNRKAEWESVRNGSSNGNSGRESAKPDTAERCIGLRVAPPGLDASGREAAGADHRSASGARPRSG